MVGICNCGMRVHSNCIIDNKLSSDTRWFGKPSEEFAIGISGDNPDSGRRPCRRSLPRKSGVRRNVPLFKFFSYAQKLFARSVKELKKKQGFFYHQYPGISAGTML